uniref:Uncharacterized protein n=1 Tax=Knipowitschia caucasica TaxID=637954 RepID=A0AAV2K8M1_KNICA
MLHKTAHTDCTAPGTALLALKRKAKVHNLPLCPAFNLTILQEHILSFFSHRVVRVILNDKVHSGHLSLWILFPPSVH